MPATHTTNAAIKQSTQYFKVESVIIYCRHVKYAILKKNSQDYQLLEEDGLVVIMLNIDVAKQVEEQVEDGGLDQVNLVGLQLLPVAQLLSPQGEILIRMS